MGDGIVLEKTGREKAYTGIDGFRLIAAFLIVAIHTSPLSSFSLRGDFIFTRIVARVAVPFFFMTSGFFLITRYTRDARKLISFEKRTARIYAAAILFYVPVNLYNGYFQKENFLPELVKDLVFDGTLYHLWYLPASMMGAAIAWYLVKKCGYKKALAVTLLLYVAGLFGDSYYGIVKLVPGLNGLYELLFQVSDYTRNGFFFAPVFFVLGGMAAETGPDFRESLWGLIVSFALMFGEAMTLHAFGFQRHDSMYIFLLPCMYFLFSLILRYRGRRAARIRTAALVIYIVHPMMIVAVRLGAKVLRLQELLVENSMAHYLVVCAASTVFAVIAAVFWEEYGRKRKKRPPERDRAYVEINPDNLEHNVRQLRALMPEGCRMMAVVKDEAYGHGAFEISTRLEKMGIEAFAVATIDEGIRLRQYGIRGKILILGYTAVHRAAELKKYDLTQTLISLEYARQLDRQKKPVKAHIKIDTGMRRLGLSWDGPSEVKKIFSMKNIRVCGMYTHLCCADSRKPEDIAFTGQQIDRFYTLTGQMEKEDMDGLALHIQSSYGLLNYPDLSCDYARIGIAMYGVLSQPEDNTLMKPDLRPVLSLKSRVVLIRSVKKGDTVGYGRAFRARRDGKIAILPIGYGDGFPRNLSCGVGSVIINGQQAPIVGRICMDQLAVDVTDLNEISCGDTATLLTVETEGRGGQYRELTAPGVAEKSASISNELLCRMGSRLPVVEKCGG